MEISVENYFRKRHSMFKWRSETSFINKIILASIMACITGIMAQIVLPLPWTPVPITAQTFAVLIAGILLGRYWGGLSMVIYLLIGFAGVPWFTGMTGGVGVITGATGGFLIGFILTALFLGYFSDNYINARGFKSMLFLLLVSNFAFIYIPGLIGLGVWLYVVNGTIPGIWTLIAMGLLPFLIGDMIKIVGAASLAKAVTPKESFNEGDNLIDSGKWRIF